MTGLFLGPWPGTDYSGLFDSSLSWGRSPERVPSKMTRPILEGRDESKGSAGKTRTCNPPVTGCPLLSQRPGLSLHPFQHQRELGACEAYWRESSSSSLCTFPATTTISSRGFAQDCHTAFNRRLGFPEFTQSFNPDCSGKLQHRHESHDDNSRIRECTFRSLFSPLASFAYILFVIYQSSSMNLCSDETPEPQHNVNNHKSRISRLCGQSLFAGGVSFVS